MRHVHTPPALFPTPYIRYRVEFVCCVLCLERTIKALFKKQQRLVGWGGVVHSIDIFKALILSLSPVFSVFQLFDLISLLFPLWK